MMMRLLRRRPRGSVDELVVLPVALATPSASSTLARREAHEVRLYVVERVLGYGWAISCDRTTIPTVEGGVLAGREVTGCVEPTALPARLTTEECRRSIEAMASRVAFTLTRGRSKDPVELQPLRAASYPFQLWYRRDRSGRIDFDAVDAVTGRRAGGPLRAAIAAALIDAEGACYRPPPQGPGRSDEPVS
jgi:hypothetical protein